MSVVRWRYKPPPRRGRWVGTGRTAARQVLLPVGDVSGTWSASGGAVPLYTMIDETTPSDTDYIFQVGT
jgi:hypothetical protein